MDRPFPSQMTSGPRTEHGPCGSGFPRPVLLLAGEMLSQKQPLSI